jgi:orotidine-5'-phosphate decarboxylase
LLAFRDRLAAAIQAKRSAVCVGLDPRFAQLPPRFAQSLPPAWALLEFNKYVIDQVADVCPIVKPQSAFYELYGADGIASLVETIRYAKSKGLLVLLDVKRGDMGATSEAYAEAYLSPDGPFDVDALTINGYQGTDCLQPFLDQAREHAKGVFVLVKTSNPSSVEIQDLRTETGEPVFEAMAKLVDRWDCEAVVGATYPREAARARELMPRATILAPGYGAQGATAQDVVPSFRADGSGAIVNNSRGIIFAADARQAAIDMRDAINAALGA